MSTQSQIEWLEGGSTWNPLGGCTKVGQGCKNCYAIRVAHRLAGNPNAKVRARYEGLVRPTSTLHGIPGTEGPTGIETRHGLNWTGTIRLFEDVLEQPLHWRAPRRVFVNSLSDLFHEDVPNAFIDRVFAVMALCPQHQFIVLTKRGERMAKYIANPRTWDGVGKEFSRLFRTLKKREANRLDAQLMGISWPLPNVVLGVSASIQAEADALIPWLLRTPAAIRIVSLEPLLGAIDFGRIPIPETPGISGSALPLKSIETTNYRPLDGVIVGGESGPGARPMHPDWARGIRDQCVAAGVPFFFKQWGTNAVSGSELGVGGSTTNQKLKTRNGSKGGRQLDGREWNEWPTSPRPAGGPLHPAERATTGGPAE